MTERLRRAWITSAVLAGAMAVQAVTGLVFRSEYRDIDWIRTTWFGNDLVTLVAYVPLLVVALVLARRGSVRALLLWAGVVGYAVYNYAFYMIGAVLSVFFPLHVAILVLSGVALVQLLAGVDAAAVATAFSPRTPVRVIGGYLVFIVVGLVSAWTAIWAQYVFNGVKPVAGIGPFQVVASLDMTLMCTLLVFGGVNLWRRRPWGYVVAPLAGVQGALYTLVLAVNSVFVNRLNGVPVFSGEFPAWTTITGVTTIAMLVLFACVGRSDRERPV